jgi:hypothetical protein
LDKQVSFNIAIDNIEKYLQNKEAVDEDIAEFQAKVIKKVYDTVDDTTTKDAE